MKRTSIWVDTGPAPADRPQLAEAAQRFAPSRRYWAIVGNGTNRVAAEELRIKLSELLEHVRYCLFIGRHVKRLTLKPPTV
jgi:DNA-binding MurR/RpiR family transcriptional regulator